jgi:Fur family ferric uptake transcriptional regulator
MGNNIERHILPAMVTTGSRSPVDGTGATVEGGLWAQIRDELRTRGLRWTPQRRLILDVLEATDGHITGAELVERCRARDPDTTPSTVYRTLDVLEELGYVQHSHAASGREEYHILPGAEHGHLECQACGQTFELEPADVAAVVAPIRSRFGFVPDVGHLTISGLCAACSA